MSLQCRTRTKTKNNFAKFKVDASDDERVAKKIINEQERAHQKNCWFAEVAEIRSQLGINNLQDNVKNISEKVKKSA